MAGARPILVVAGVGNGSGTGAATARLFAKAGYNVALIARNADHLKKTADDISAAGGTAAAFPIASYEPKNVTSAFDAIKKHWPNEEIRVAVYNSGFGVWKKFLELTDEEIQESLQTNVAAAFAFSRAAILAFQKLSLNEQGKRGTLIFTGATASLRGNKTTSGFATGKFALRALSQSLNKEFGVQNIHVAHAIIDGGILTDRSKDYRGGDFADNADKHLKPESIANSYLYLANQDRSAWTWELDLRPAHETW